MPDTPPDRPTDDASDEPSSPFPLASGTSLDETLGIEYQEVSPTRVRATMPVGPRVHQPLGYLHGGASVVLAESVASVGATTAALPEKVAFGLEINANHLRPKKDGTLHATGTPIHQGRTTAVWEIRVTDEADRLVCISRCTLALVNAGSR